MKKIIVGLLTFIVVSFTTYTYGSQVITLVTQSSNSEQITIIQGEATVFGFSRKIKNIAFSKTSGFTIRTLEGGVWRDLSDNINDYSPITGILARNITQGDLVITATYADVVSIENTIFQKSLKAGWNLISPAYKDDINGLVNSDNSLGASLPYSQVLDFTGNGFVYSGEPIVVTPNHNLDSTNYQIKTKAEIANTYLVEKLAYGLFVNIDSVISGSQKITTSEFVYSAENQICDDVSRLLGLCGTQYNYYLSVASTLASKGIIKDNSNNVNNYNVNSNITRGEIAVLMRGLAGIAKTITCSNIFSDVDSTFTTNSNIFNFQDNVICNSVEALVNNGLISSSPNYYPNNFLTKSEAVGMIVKSTYGSEYQFNSGSIDSWQKQVVDFAATKGIMNNFSNYDTNATKGFVFGLANEALNNINTINTCDEVSALLGLCTITGTGTTSTGTTSTGTTSTCDEVSALLGLCTIPTNLQVTNTGSTQVSLSWDNLSNATRYNIYYGTSEIEVLLATSTFKTTTSTGITISSLIPETPYVFGIQAVNPDGSTSKINTLVRTTTTACDEPSQLLGLCTITITAPTNLRATNIGTGSIDLAWDQPIGANNYSIKYGVDLTSTGTIINNIITNSDTIQFIGSGTLVPLTTYQIQVKAYSGTTLFSPYSPIINVTTK